MAAIEVDNLTKRYRKATAVDGLSFDVSPGVVTGFLGPNGAGKTTTIRCILGLARPTSGEVRIGGRTPRSAHEGLRHIGVALEGSGFHPGRTGRAHLEVLALENKFAPARVGEVLALVGLEAAAKRRVKSYSLGMRQRLAVAAALLGEPEVLVLDEPGNGLDPAGIRWMRDLLRSHAARGGAVLVSSHVLSEVAQLADEVVIMAQGRLVERGSVKDLIAGSAAAVIVRSSDMASLRSAMSEGGLATEETPDGALRVISKDPEAVAALAAKAGVPLLGLAMEEANLEDVFLKLTEGRGL